MKVQVALTFEVKDPKKLHDSAQYLGLSSAVIEECSIERLTAILIDLLLNHEEDETLDRAGLSLISTQGQVVSG